MTFSKEMMEALEVDRQKLESMGMPQITSADVFHCRKCGCRGESNFSWDGNCLVCEEYGDEF